MAAYIAKTIVILGASFGGLPLSRYRPLPSEAYHPNIKAPTQRGVYYYLDQSVLSSYLSACLPTRHDIWRHPMLPRDKLFVDIHPQFQQYGGQHFRFIQATATKLDHRLRTVTIRTHDGATETIIFHAVVLATGASTPSPLFGLNRDEKFLRKCWDSFREVFPTTKSIVIAGGGPACIETAGELDEYLNHRAGLFSLPGPSPNSRPVKITVVTSSGQVVVVAVGPDHVDREDTRETQMVPIGRRNGVGAAMGFQMPSFLVWLIKGRDYWLWTTGDLWSGKKWAKAS